MQISSDIRYLQRSAAPGPGCNDALQNKLREKLQSRAALLPLIPCFYPPPVSDDMQLTTKLCTLTLSSQDPCLQWMYLATRGVFAKCVKMCNQMCKMQSSQSYKLCLHKVIKLCKVPVSVRAEGGRHDPRHQHRDLPRHQLRRGEYWHLIGPHFIILHPVPETSQTLMTVKWKVTQQRSCMKHQLRKLWDWWNGLTGIFQRYSQ